MQKRKYILELCQWLFTSSQILSLFVCDVFHIVYLMNLWLKVTLCNFELMSLVWIQKAPSLSTFTHRCTLPLIYLMFLIFDSVWPKRNYFGRLDESIVINSKTKVKFEFKCTYVYKMCKNCILFAVIPVVIIHKLQWNNLTYFRKNVCSAKIKHGRFIYYGCMKMILHRQKWFLADRMLNV